MTEKPNAWHTNSVSEIVRIFETDIRSGLDSASARRRRMKEGPNALPPSHHSLFASLVDEIRNPLSLLLLFAVLMTLFLKEYLDAIVICAALVINIAIALYQRGRADHAFELLRDAEEKFAVVIRDGKRQRISASDLVRGDIIVLETGTKIPADARIISSSNAMVSESILTGEWADVMKGEKILDRVIPIQERVNMLFSGTLMTGGVAEAVVVATGKDTEFGRIATLLGTTESGKTPLKKSIERIARIVSFIAAAILLVIMIAGYLRGNPIEELLLTAIAIAIAAVPEGLPAAVTVVLAVGMESLLKRGGLVRNLLAAETLGGTTVIITDKTGTLTRADMRVAHIITLGSLRAAKAHPGGRTEHEAHGDERDALEFATLACDGFLEGIDEKGEPIVHGRPVEKAILIAGALSGLPQTDVLQRSPQIGTFPFTSVARTSISLNAVGGIKARRLTLLGAPEVILDAAKTVYFEGKPEVLTESVREDFRRIIHKYAADGMRIVAVGYHDTSMKELGADSPEARQKILEKISFTGVIVLNDPLRSDVPNAIMTAKEAGTRVIMATGDEAHTARSIAREAGIWKEGDGIVKGTDMARLNDDELLKALKTTTVLARMLPEDKLRVVRILTEAGEVVAMTGDGVNDAPALRAASIGIALGSGSDVAKEASDLVLEENSFAVIVAAIEEGRRIADNIRKAVAYLLATSMTEIIAVGGSIIVGLPLPLTALQILWANILTEGFMNFSYAFEPKEEDIMRRDPRSASTKGIVSSTMLRFVIFLGTITGLVLLAVHTILVFVLHFTEDESRTVVFLLLSLGTIMLALPLKDLREPLRRISPFSNRYFIITAGFSLLGLLAAFLISPLASILRLDIPSLGNVLLITIPTLLLLISVAEWAKYLFFDRRPRA